MERIVATGGEASERRGLELEWVYLPELDTSLHWPELVRVLRRRPRRSTLRLLSSVVEGCEPARRGALVPALVEIRSRATHRSARKLVDRALAAVIGYPPEEESSAIDWYRQWRRAGELADGGDPPAADELLALYRRAPASAPLREVVVRAALRHRVSPLVPDFFGDLSSRDEDLRRIGYLGLRGFHPEGLPPFDPEGRSATRREQVTRIEDFLRAKGAL